MWISVERQARWRGRRRFDGRAPQNLFLRTGGACKTYDTHAHKSRVAADFGAFAHAIEDAATHELEHIREDIASRHHSSSATAALASKDIDEILNEDAEVHADTSNPDVLRASSSGEFAAKWARDAVPLDMMKI